MSQHPFQDLQRKRAGHSRHIRLISEGGSSIAKSPLPQCIDSIQVNHTCTTESHHLASRTGVGACSMFSLPDSSLFSVPSEQAAQLDQGLISPVLRSRFIQQGITLSERVQVEVRHPGRIWFIRDQDGKYSVRRLPSRLTVYKDTK